MPNADQIIKATRYVQRAQDFLRGAQFFSDGQDPDYEQSAGLLAVHAAISLGDALSIYFGGERSKADDHGEAATRLEKLLNKKSLDSLGVTQHMADIIGWKNEIAYEDNRVSPDKIKRAVMKAQRFFDWAFTTHKEFARDTGGEQ